MTEQLGAILIYMERLASVDTRDVRPLAHVHDALCPLRDDEVTGSLPPGTAVAEAPAASGPSFQVPRVIGSGE